jgi:peroxiredoxin Q/BCP
MPPSKSTAKSKRPAVGDKAPEFDLPAYPKGRVSLKHFHGKKNVVLYFYPRDNTPGCTREACDFRDHMEAFDKSRTVVLGLSTDTPETHAKFAGKFELSFPLLSDADHKVCEKYGVWVEKNMYGKKSMGLQRSTFLIDKAGKIAAVWPRVKVDGHVAEVTQALAEIK